MSTEKRWYLISYDVRAPIRLRKVSKHMKGYGKRIQYSVFRCRMTERELERLRWELGRLMDDEDDLLIVGLCPACVNRIRKRQGEGAWPDDPPSFEVI